MDIDGWMIETADLVVIRTDTHGSVTLTPALLDQSYGMPTDRP